MAKREIKTIFAIDGEQKYKDAIKSINKEQSLLKAEMKAVNDAFNESGDSQKKLTTQADNLARQIDLQKRKIEETKHAVEQSAKIYGEADSRTNDYRIQLANAESQLGKLQSQLAKTNKEILLQNDNWLKAGESIEKAGKKMQNAGEKMDKVGKGLSIGVTAPIVAAGTGLLELGNKFDDAVDTIRIGTGATGEALNGLQKDFEAVIGKVPADMDKAASAIADLNTRLGLTGEPLQKLAQQYLELAHITGEDVTTSIKESTEAFQAWNIDSSKYADSLDHLFKVSQSTGIKVNELSQKVAAATPAARQLGYTYEETANMVGYFEKNGLDAAQMMAGLQKAIVNNTKDGEKLTAQLQKESQKLADLKKKYDEVVKAKGKDSEAAKRLAKEIENQTEVTTAAEKQLQKQVEMSKETLNQLIDRIKNATNQQEAMNIATEAFGSRAGVQFVDAIKSGKFNLDEFNASIANNTETINSAAEDTYDYAEQWKMLANQLAKDLKPVAEQIFNAVNSATPIIKDAAEWVGNLAQKFSELSPQQQETILKMIALAAAAGPVVAVTGKVTGAIGSATEGIGKFIEKLAEKKAAEEAAKLATEGVSAASTGLAGVLGPAGIATLAIAGITALVWGLNEAYQAGIRPAKEAEEAAVSFMKGVADWRDGVETAKSALSDFNMETIVTREKMAELEDGIRTAQDNIIKIAETAAAESREYTEEERRQIEELIGLIVDYTNKKIKAYQEQARVVAAMATTERNISMERAYELIKAAEESRDKTLAIAEAQYTEQVAEAEKLYGHLGEKDRKAYLEHIQLAQKQKDDALEIARSTYTETLSIIQEKYTQYNAQDMAYLKQIIAINQELETLETRKNELFLKKSEERKAQLNSETLSVQEQAKIRMSVENWFVDEQNRLYEELEEAFKGAEESNLDSWLGMVQSTKEHGGEISIETQKIIDGIIQAYGNLPEKAQSTMNQTMEGMLKGMAARENEVYDYATMIANNTLKRMERAFDIKSPSRKMQKIYEQLFAGAEKPMADAQKRLPAEMQKIAESMMAEAAKISNPSIYLNPGSGRIDMASNYIEQPNIKSVAPVNNIYIDRLMVNSDELQDVSRLVKMFENLEQTARAMGRRG